MARGRCHVQWGFGYVNRSLRDQSSITKSCRADALLIVIAAIQDWIGF